MKIGRVVLTVLFAAELAVAQSEYLAPPVTLKLDGIPNIPASLGVAMRGYLTSSSDSPVGWDPVSGELVFARRQTNRPWMLCSIATPDGAPSELRPYPNGANSVHQNPKRRYVVFEFDPTPGAERIQLQGYDLEKRAAVLLTDGKSQNYYPLFSNAGDRMMYSSTKRDGKRMDLYVMDPLDSKSDRMIAQLYGEDWAALDWSPDDRKVLLREYLMSSESYLWLLDVASGAKVRLTDPPHNGKVSIGPTAQFSRDGKGVYFTTDLDSDFSRLAYLDLSTKRVNYLSGRINWDVEQFALSPGRSLLAFTTNENGFSRLHVLDLSKKGNQIKLIDLPDGVVDKLRWDGQGDRLAFAVSSAAVPGDIYSLEIRSGKVVRWTKTGEIQAGELAKPELIKWQSFDGKAIPAFLYRPPAKFAGPRPVIINAHGGPAAQYRPGFREADNYFTTDLGVAMIYPNIRGSTGYGKAYLDSDNGYLRQNAIRDIGALLDWIGKQPGLDASRILVRGQSYGGYIALAVATSYGDRIAGAISISGPSNLVTDLERTDVSRQDRRRAEYGDERDPGMRRFLESIAPVANASKVQRPLLIVQGKNDTRVVAGESEQMVTAVRKSGTPVWYLLALYEGHVFAGARTILFSLCTQALFAKTVLALTI